jgi:hypothetical protein
LSIFLTPARVFHPSSLSTRTSSSNISSPPSSTPIAIPAAHVTQFFTDLIAGNAIGIVTPTAFTEPAHVLVRAR